MKRILLKLSGEALAGDKHHGFDEPTVTVVAKQVKQLVDAGVQVGIVIGGGNFWRGLVAVGFQRVAGNLPVNPSQRVEFPPALGCVRFVFQCLQDVAERYLRGIHGVECIVERRSGELEAAYVARGLEPDVGRFEQDRRPDTAVVVHQVGDRRFGDVSADAE